MGLRTDGVREVQDPMGLAGGVEHALSVRQLNLALAVGARVTPQKLQCREVTDLKLGCIQACEHLGADPSGTGCVPGVVDLDGGIAPASESYILSLHDALPCRRV